MSGEEDVDNLDGVLDELEKTSRERERVTVQDIMEAAEHRSFGALLLVPGLISVTPVGGVPGVPTAMAIILVLIAGQILLGLKSFWLPGFIRRRSFPAEKMAKSIDFLRPVARVIDKVLRPRFTRVTRPPATYVIAATCILIGLMMPPLELVPFAVTVPSLAIIAFGLALIAHDGVVGLLAFAFSCATLYIVVTTLMPI